MNSFNFCCIRWHKNSFSIKLHSLLVIPYFQCRVIYKSHNNDTITNTVPNKPKIAHAIIIATAIQLDYTQKLIRKANILIFCMREEENRKRSVFVCVYATKQRKFRREKLRFYNKIKGGMKFFCKLSMCISFAKTWNNGTERQHRCFLLFSFIMIISYAILISYG